MGPFRKKGKKSNSAKKSVKKAIKAASAKIFTKKVKNVVSNLAEKKVYRYSYSLTEVAGLNYFTGSAWGLDNGIFAVTPFQNRISITQGTTQSTRIGNKIRTHSNILDGILITQPYNLSYNAVPQPTNVLLYIFKIKGGGDTFDATMSGFYQNNNSSITPTSTLLDTLLEVNSDNYTVLYKRMYKVGFAENAATGNDPNNQRYTNNDYKRNVRFRIDLTKYTDKVIKYNDNSTTPTNNILYCAIMPIPTDSYIPSAGNGIRPVGLVLNQTFTYTDD